MTSHAGAQVPEFFKVRNHPKLRDVWPGEPGGGYERSFRVPLAGEDILREVFYYAPVAEAKANVALLTEYERQKNTRDMLFHDARFASRFANWLRHRVGQSIQAIGDSEIDL
jgi:hypothetical protein